jgi:hypothetical protein
MGLQPVLSKLSPGDAPQMEKLKDVLTGIKLAPEFIALTTGGGKNSPGPLAARISYVEKGLQHAFG